MLTAGAEVPVSRQSRRHARWPVILGMLAALAGCSAKDSPSAPVPTVPVVPDVGTPAGAPVTRSIGPAGGTIVTADSAFSVTIPAGAIATSTDVTLRPYVNTAPNSFGLEYRLEPATLRLAKPLIAKLSVPVASLGSVHPTWVGVAVRRNGVWYADVRSTSQVRSTAPRITSLGGTPVAMREGAAGVVDVSVEEDELPPLPPPERWTTVTFWRMEPASATVRVGQAVPLAVNACTRDTDVLGNALIPMIEVCVPSIREATWSVNGRVGGSDQVGRATTGSPQSSGEFTAPARVPSPGTVNVTATMFWRARGLTSRPLGPIPITITGGDLVGGASGTVSSRLVDVGALYDYKAVVTWERVPGIGLPGLDEYRINPAKSWVKYSARNRCITNMQPDSVAIAQPSAWLNIDNATGRWTALDPQIYPQIGYYDACAKLSTLLPYSGAPIIGAGDSLPVKGIYPDDPTFGVKIEMAFSYVYEGAAPRVAPQVQGANFGASGRRVTAGTITQGSPPLQHADARITLQRAPIRTSVGVPFF